MKTIFTSISCLILSLLCMNPATAQSKKPAKGPTEEAAPVSSIILSSAIYDTHIPIFVQSSHGNGYKVTFTVDGQAMDAPSTATCAPGFKCVGYVDPNNLASVRVYVKVDRKNKEATLYKDLSSLGRHRIDKQPLCRMSYYLIMERKRCSIELPSHRTKQGEVYIISVWEDRMREGDSSDC